MLCTIPGVQTHAAQVLIAECGLNMTLFPTVGHFASWAGVCPGHHQSAGRRGSGRHPPRTALAHRPADRMREGGGPHQEHLPLRSLRTAPRPPRRSQGDRGDPPRPAGRLLPHRPRRGPVSGPRTGLATQAVLRRAPRPPPTAPTRSARLRRHPRPNRTTARRASRLTPPNKRAGLPPTDRRRERLRPKRGRNSGIHRTASVRTGSEVGVDEGGCSPTRARARCACRSSRSGRQQAHRRLPQSRQRRAAGVADHNAGPSRASRCAPLAKSASLAQDGPTHAFVRARVSLLTALAWLADVRHRKREAGLADVESLTSLRRRRRPVLHLWR